MAPPFPLSPAPAWFTYARWKDVDTKRNAVFEVGETVSIRLNASGANAYSVRDYSGDVVGSGSVSGTQLDLGNAWNPGWYRVYFTGPNTDGVFGPAYAATNFTVIRHSDNFPDLPLGNQIGIGWGDQEGSGNDNIMRGALAMGSCRQTLLFMTEPGFSGNNYVNPDPDSWLGKVGNESTFGRDWWTAAPTIDPARRRYSWAAFTNFEEWDRVELPGSGGDYLHCYCKDDSINGSLVFVALAAGSSSGRKVTVRYPDSTTIVETYDNLPDSPTATTTINAASAYIHACDGGHSSTSTLAATAIGNAKRTMAVGAVSYLWGLGLTHFEGPWNEPELGNPNVAAEAAHTMKLFQSYVHAGNADAKAIGPCPVSLDFGSFKKFLDAGGGEWCDEISFHDYNSMTNGNLAQGRYVIERFLQLLDHYGLSDKPLWQTEANNVMLSVYGVYHPRRARFHMLHTLLWEQYGVPRERNVPWYDSSHGFWGYPTWLEMGDASLNPMCAMYRVLAEETWGQVHDHRLRFGEIGDKIFLGSIYRGEDGSRTLVVLSATHMDGATVTLTVTGASSVTTVDAFGNTATATVTSGRTTVAVDDIPTYVRLPVGVNATVYSVNDWGPDPPPSISGKALDVKIGSTFTMVPVDDSFMVDYNSGIGAYYSAAALPENITILWPETVDVDRVMVVCGQAWQSAATLWDFDVQTTTNGVDFTTRAGVSKATPSSFLFGNDNQNSGCSRETYWDEQWIFDVPLGATYACTGIRIVANEASYGGEPDAACVAAGGQGNATPRLVIQEVFVPSASLPDEPTVTPKTADFELGTNGATIATGDPGSLTAWDAVSGTPTYDTVEAAHGAKSMKLSTGSVEYVSWNLTNLTDHYGRFHIKQGVAGDVVRVAYFYNGATLTASFQLRNSDGTLAISDTSNASDYHGITSLDPGRWYRVEYHIVHSAAVGQIHARIYDSATGELRETIISPATWDTKTQTTICYFGAPTTGAGQQHWMDEIAAAADAYLGPPAVTAGAERVGVVKI